MEIIELEKEWKHGRAWAFWEKGYREWYFRYEGVYMYITLRELSRKTWAVNIVECEKIRDV